MFITLDGVDGVGKSTQISLLASWLEGQGRTVCTCREPGSTGLGERVRSLLLDKANFEISVRSEMLLYMAARAQLVEEIIQPALARGETVICDRFLLASQVYQGVAGGLGVPAVTQVGEIAVAGTMPDLAIVLDLPLETALARIGREMDRMEAKGAEFLQRVRDGYLSLAESDDTIVVVSAEGSADEVQARIRTQIETLLLQTGGDHSR